MERRVFICYAHEDLETARRLYVDLKNFGANPWLDKEDILPGQRWRRVIKHTIRESSHVLVLISKHSVNKRGYVQKELLQVLEVLEETPQNQIFIIPCRVDDSQPTDRKLAEFQWVDLFPSYDDGFSRIVQSLGLASADVVIEMLADWIGSPSSYPFSIDKATAKETFELEPTRTGSRFQSEPLIRARVMHSIGTISQKLGSYEVAIQYLENARDNYSDMVIDLVESLHAVANVMSEKGDLDRAEEFIHQALEMRHKIKNDKAPCVVDCMALWGRILFLKGQLDNAEKTLRETLRLCRERSDQHSCLTTTANSTHELAQVLSAKKDYAGVEEILRKLLQEQFSSLGCRHPDVAYTMNSLALTIVRKNERLDEAEELYEEALVIRRDVLGSSHPETALTINNLAHLLQRKGEYPAAERLFKESISMFEQGVGEIHLFTAFAKYSLARLYRSIGHPEQARSWLTESLATYHKILGEDHPEIALIMAEMKDIVEQVD